MDRLPDPVREFLSRRASEITGLSLLALMAAVTLSLASWSVDDPSLNNATSVRWRSKLYQKLYDYTSRVEMPLGAFNWRVKAGDTTKITDYKAGTLKLTRELSESELGWSASAPVAPAQLAEWFGNPELAKQKSLPLGGKPGGYSKWAWIATIGMVFLNFGNILNGRFVPILIGLAFLWFPAKLADKLSGKDE